MAARGWAGRGRQEAEREGETGAFWVTNDLAWPWAVDTTPRFCQNPDNFAARGGNLSGRGKKIQKARGCPDGERPDHAKKCAGTSRKGTEARL